MPSLIRRKRQEMRWANHRCDSQPVQTVQHVGSVQASGSNWGWRGRERRLRRWRTSHLGGWMGMTDGFSLTVCLAQGKYMNVLLFLGYLLRTNSPLSHSHPALSADLFPLTISSAEIWTSDKKYKEDMSLSCAVLACLFVLSFLSPVPSST